MKKLTAGIFATLLAVVSADGAYAAIASKGYVDGKVGEVQTTVAAKADSSTVTALDGRVDAAESEIDTLQTQMKGKQDALGFTPENSANKTTTLSGTSTDTQYPSAKAVWDTIQTETEGIASSGDLSALGTRVTTAEGEIDTLQTQMAGKQDKLTQTGSANQPVYVDATGKVTAGNTIPTVTTTIAAGQTDAAQAGAVATALAAKANSADLGALAKLNSVGSAQITDGAVATTDIASKAVTKEKLADAIVTSLGKADTALQKASLDGYLTKTAADAAYAGKTLETQVGTVSAENMGTTATTVVTAIKEVASEAATAQSTATGAQSAVDAVESTIEGYGDIVTHNAAEFATTTALTSGLAGKLDKDGTAARATADASGNVITTTYATKAEIADLATDENLKLKQDKTDNTLETTSKTVVGAINEVKEQADKGVSDAATAKSAADAAKTAADSKLPTSTYNSQVGTVTAGNMGTTATTVVTAIKEVAGEASAAQSAAGAAQDAAEAAQATANAAIPKVNAEGSDGKYVLTATAANGVATYKWELIARDGEGE